MPNKVYVINKHGRPLMPCSPAKARHLLDDGKAKVKKRTPFTIQLVYGSSGYTQEVILGVDAGSKTIGMSASTTKEELLSAEVKPRNDVVDLLSARREFRRARRNRKTRYRKPRFDNRVRSKHKGWLAPSVEVKIQEHITSIKRVCRILPVSKVVIRILISGGCLVGVGILLAFIEIKIAGLYKKYCWDMITIMVILVSMAIAIYFADWIRTILPVNLLFLLLLVQVIYVVIRWYVKGWRETRGYY